MNRLPLFLRSAPLLLGLLACEPTEREHGADVNPLDLPGNIVSGDSVLLRFAALPYTIKDQAEVSFPDSSLPALDSLASFLNKHPDHRLSVMGIYDARETKPGNGSDLGILRAINIKRILAERGIDTLSVSLLSRMDDLAFDNDGKISDGYRFRLMKDSLAAGSELNRTVYFWAAEDLIRWDPELREYVAQAQAYLASRPGMRMVLTGHTDYNGNHLLGAMRAESLKEYFGRYGLDTSRVDIRSEGPDQPVAPNDTQENKSKNRRVEVSFE